MLMLVCTPVTLALRAQLRHHTRLIAVAALLLASSLRQAGGTEIIFVLADEGVWIAADSIRVHRGEDGVVTHSTLCKLYESPGRVFFNAGSFRDLTELARNEIALPLEDPLETWRKVRILLLNNHQTRLSADSLETAGFVQARNGSFEGMRIGFVGDFVELPPKMVYLNQKGIPHGFGINVDQKNKEAAHDPKVANKFIKNPRLQLLKMLEDAASVPNSDVAAPFNVLLLKKDGSITDDSDNSLCKNIHGLPMP